MSLFGLLEQMVEVDMQNVVIKFLHFVQVYQMVQQFAQDMKLVEVKVVQYFEMVFEILDVVNLIHTMQFFQVNQ